MTTTSEFKEKVVEHVNKNPNFLKIYIFHKATNAVLKKPNHYTHRFYSIQEQCYRSYKKMCEKYGDDAMDYQEFEFWYMRFSRGEFDMDYDRSSDPKTRSFTDPPVQIFEKIAENWNIADNLILRKVCKSIESLIDSWPCTIKSIIIEQRDSGATMQLDDHRICYNNYYGDRFGDNNSKICRINSTNNHNAVKNRSFFSVVCDDLTAIFKNPSLKLSILELKHPKAEQIRQFYEIFSNGNLNSRPIGVLHVEKLRIIPTYSDSMDVNVIQILQYFKPGILQEIHLDLVISTGHSSLFKTHMKRICHTEVIQQAEILKFGGFIARVVAPFDCFSELKRVTVELNHRMTPKVVANSVQTLLKSPILEHFQLVHQEYTFGLAAINRMLATTVVPIENRPNVFLHLCPQSDRQFEVEITRKSIRIEKMSG